MSWLIKACVNVHNPHDDDWTALALAILQGRVPVVDLLLRAGAFTEIRDRPGFTALALAAIGGYLGI